MGWGPGLAKGPKFPKHALIVTSPPENPHRKRKSFFFDVN